MSLGVNSIFQRSIFRFTIVLCALFVLVLIISGITLNWALRHQVEQDIDDGLIQAYADLLNDDISADDLAYWHRELSEQGGFNDFAFRTADGRVLGSLRPAIFDREGLHTHSAHAFFADRFYNRYKSLSNDDFDDDRDEDIYPEIDDDDPNWRVYVGAFADGHVAFFEPLEGAEDALEVVPWILAMIGALLVGTTLLSGAILAHRQQRRVDAIGLGLRRMGQGNLTTPIAPARIKDDLDQIMNDIDDAADQVNQSMSQLRLFSQNVAHELNTPLARLRAQLETMDETTESQIALRQVDDVIKTLTGVQRIARLSHRADISSFQPIEMPKIAALMGELYCDVAAENNQRLIVELDDPAPIVGDFQLIAQMTSNLIENAMRHGARETGGMGQITARFAAHAITIQDNGPGISQDAAAEIFMPFKGDLGAGGSGLGLALVQAIAQYHNAKIDLNPGPGFSLTIRFPDPETSSGFHNVK